MRILVISQYFWPENFRINDLAAGLVERGYEITVLTGSPNYPGGRFFPGYQFINKQEKYHGVHVVRVPLVPRGNGKGVRLIVNYLFYAFSASILGPILCRGKFDLIFVCQLSPVTVGIPARVFKKIKKIPILFWILDLWPESLSATGAVRSQGILKKIDTLVRFIYHGCDKIVVSSLGFIPSVAAKGINRERIGYFPNWQEPEYGDTVPVTEYLPQGFRIVFAGNIGVAQDFETILSAAEKLKRYNEILWVILGDGRRREWVKSQVEKRGLSASFHLMGRYPSEAMPGFFAQADVLLVTLKRDPAFALTVPGKIQSYMSCGRPVVAALDGEGGRLVVESGAGLSVPAGDVDGLVHAVLTMYRMPKSDRDAMGIRGKEYCSAHFGRTLLMDRLEGWLNDLKSVRAVG
jgi:colanic acid biosynthesis glycosyl transferase WcaI